ncbi:MAG TPA: alpha/beta hydrolase [Bacillota bacterium]|nr:alpha/beta hydrolase [Bacillota bacterium]
MQIPIQIGVKGEAVLGMLHVPEKRAPGSPVILLCCGLDGKRAEVHRMATLMARRGEKLGVTMLRFDYRGLGVSQGEFWRTSISKKIEDTLAVIDFLKGCFQGDQFTLIPLGFSDGARIAAGLFKKREGISGLAFWSPIFYSVAANFAGYQPGARISRHPATHELVYPFNGLWLGIDYLKEQTAMGNALQDFYGFEGPRLVVFGGADPETGETHRELEALTEDKKKGLTVITVPGANHTFNHGDWSLQVINQTLEWSLAVGKEVLCNGVIAD